MVLGNIQRKGMGILSQFRILETVARNMNIRGTSQGRLIEEHRSPQTEMRNTLLETGGKVIFADRTVLFRVVFVFLVSFVS